MTHTEKTERIHRTANKLYTDVPDWATFFREILGLNGLVRQMFSDRESLEEFERSETYQEILRMLTKLRQRRGKPAEQPELTEQSQQSQQPEKPEPTRVVTVRLPKSLHDAIRVEAFEHHTSMNKLCISKLLQIIDDELVPAEA